MTQDDIARIPSPSDEPSSEATKEVFSVIGAFDDDEDVERRLAYESLMRHRKARRRKRAIAAAAVAGLLVAAAVVWSVVTGSGGDGSDDTTLSTMTVYASDFSESVSATGSAEALTSMAVTPEVDGIIETVSVAEGDYVEAGQTLFTIKNDELDKAVRDAELAVKKATTALSNAQTAKSDAWKAVEAGYVDEAVSVEDYNQLVAAYNTAANDVTAAQYDLDDANEAYDVAVSNAAKRTVAAPQAGSIVSCKAVVGESIGASASGSSSGSLVTIADLSQMKVKVQVNEVDISKIAVGQEARVSFSALSGEEFAASVTRIATTTSSDESGYDYGVVTYDVELLIPEPTSSLKPGMTANVEILQQYVANAVTVPVSALATDDGESYYVYVMTDAENQVCERREVTLGARSDSLAVVESGLYEGEELVLDPYAVALADEAGEAYGVMAIDETSAETDEADETSAETSEDAENTESSDASDAAETSD